MKKMLILASLLATSAAFAATGGTDSKTDTNPLTEAVKRSAEKANLKHKDQEEALINEQELEIEAWEEIMDELFLSGSDDNA